MFVETLIKNVFTKKNEKRKKTERYKSLKFSGVFMCVYTYMSEKEEEEEEKTRCKLGPNA